VLGRADHLLRAARPSPTADAPRAVPREPRREGPLVASHADGPRRARACPAARGAAVGLPRASRALHAQHLRGHSRERGAPVTEATDPTDATDATDANDPVGELLAVLDLHRDGADTFTGRSLPQLNRRVYGGQVLAQSLLAAG